MTADASPSPPSAATPLPASTEWVSQLLYPVQPLTVIPHNHLFRVYGGQQITAPSAAFDAAVLDTVVRGAHSVAPSPSSLRTLVDRSADRAAYNDALLDCYQASHGNERTADIVQPWLLLAMMRTPADDAAEHARVTAVLQRVCKARRYAAAAVRCTAALLCLPDILRTVLVMPLFRWHYVYQQHNLTAVLQHLGAVVNACVLASGAAEVTFREVRGIVQQLAASPQSLTPALPRRAAAAVALASIAAHCADDSEASLPPPSPTLAVVLDLTGPADALPAITEQLLPATSKDAVTLAKEVVDAVRGGAKKRKGGAPTQYPVERVEEMAETEEGMRFRVRWKGYKPSDDTWEPLTSMKGVDQFEAFLKRLCKERDEERARHKRQLGEEQNKTVLLRLELRAMQRAQGTGGNFELDGFAVQSD